MPEAASVVAIGQINLLLVADETLSVSDITWRDLSGAKWTKNTQLSHVIPM